MINIELFIDENTKLYPSVSKCTVLQITNTFLYLCFFKLLNGIDQQSSCHQQAAISNQQTLIKQIIKTTRNLFISHSNTPHFVRKNGESIGQYNCQLPNY